MGTFRNLSPGQYSRLWLKIQDSDSSTVAYIPWEQVVSVMDDGTVISLRLPVDSPGQGNQTDPVVVDITDPQDVADIRSLLEAAWNLEVGANIGSP